MTKNDLIELILFFTYLTLTMNLFFAISIILALVIHELGHAVFFKIYNYKIDKFKIGFFYGYVRPVEEINLPCYKEINLFFAGPLFNFMTACICFIIGIIFPITIQFSIPLMTANLLMFVGNMIPVGALDGGRVILSVFNRFNLNKNILLCFQVFLVSAITTFVNIYFGIFLLAVLIMSLGLFLDESCTMKNHGELTRTKE